MKRTMSAVMVLMMMAAAAWAEEGPEVPGRGENVLNRQLHGAWKVTQIPGEGGPPPFEMLMVFTRDGGVVQTDAGPPNPLQFSPGIGEWKRTGNGYSVGYTQLEFDVAQNHVGVFRAKLDVTVDEDKNTMTGTVRVRFYDLNDTLLFEAEGTVEGRRLAIE